MRISDRILPVVLFASGLGLASAFAFDGTRTPGDVAPPVGIDVLPRAAGPAAGAGALNAPNPQGGPTEAFQSGTRALRAGDTKTGISALEYAAANGHTIAQWKLGRMYADGDGVKQDELRAFEYFRGIADAHAEEAPGTPQARFVANAFVALGNYYLEGIPGTAVKPDPDRAREMFGYAASYFGDPDAQYRLGRMYLDGNGTLKEPKQAARWLSLAARKGQYQAQAVLGAMLFKGEYTPRQAARGLMWLTLARDGASARETWIADLYSAAMKQATEEERVAALGYLERWLKGHRDF
jgi:exopolysaccharide production negative regulator